MSNKEWFLSSKQPKKEQTMNGKLHLTKIQDLRYSIQHLTSELAKLEAMKYLYIYCQNGSVFRTFDLSGFTCDEERTLNAYKYLFEEKHYTQLEIGTMVYQWATGKETVSNPTIYKNWNIYSIAKSFSYAQFKKAILKATKNESASISQAFTRF